MNIELYDFLNDKYELYNKLEKGIKSIENGDVYLAENVFDEIEIL